MNNHNQQQLPYHVRQRALHRINFMGVLLLTLLLSGLGLQLCSVQLLKTVDTPSTRSYTQANFSINKTSNTNEKNSNKQDITQETQEEKNTPHQQRSLNMIQIAIDKITTQQPQEHNAVFMIGEQLKDMCRTIPNAAHIIAQDLDIPELSLQHAAKQLENYASKHRKGNFFCVTPQMADTILREFYGLPPNEGSQPLTYHSTPDYTSSPVCSDTLDSSHTQQQLQHNLPQKMVHIALDDYL